MLSVNSDVKFIKGVGPKSQIELNKIGIYTVMDLLLYFPRAYEGVNFVENIKNCEDKEKIFIYAKVFKINSDIRVKANMTISSVIFQQNGSKFTAKWFNQPYIKNSLKIDETYLLKGVCKVVGKNIELTNPQIIRNSKEDKNKIIAIYPQKGNITNNYLNKIITNLLVDIRIIDNLPQHIIKKYKLLDLDNAIRNIHCPKGRELLENAKRRLKFQELFTYSMKILWLRAISQSNIGNSIPVSSELIKLKESIPFQLTEAQCRVIREILLDQKSPSVMNRLVQGDVGSGAIRFA